MEKELLKLFNAGLITVGSAGHGLPIPAGAIRACDDLADFIAARGEAEHFKPALLELAADIKRELSNRTASAEDLIHHLRKLPELIDALRPDPVAVRSAIETFSSKKSKFPDRESTPVPLLVHSILSRAEKSRELEKLGLDTSLSGRILAALFANLLTNHIHISALRGAFVEYHTDAQIRLAVGTLTHAAEVRGTKEFWVAIEALELAQQIQAEDMVPENWAKIQNDKGAAIGMIGERLGDPIKLRQAMDMLATAADIWDRETTPDRWAETEVNLGNAGWLLGLIENRPDLLRTSFRKLEAAHAAYEDIGFDEQAKIIHANLERMLIMIREEKKIA